MNPGAIPGAKHLIGKLTDEKVREIANQAMSFGTAAKTEQFMRDALALMSYS